MTTTIDDLIILGRAVPELISNGRTTVCVAGYSPTYGMIRIYPTRPDSPLQQWSIVRVRVERNPNDNRAESWKLAGSTDWDNINRNITKVGELPHHQRLPLVHSLAITCVSLLNQPPYRSLGIVEPVIYRWWFDENEQYYKAHQPMFDIIEPAVIRTKRDYPMQPRFEYRCGNQCQSRSRHDQQLLEWGCFEFIKKCHDYNQINGIWRNMGIGSKEWRHFFVVGNQANQRTSFMVINVIRQKITDVQSMIPFDRL